MILDIPIIVIGHLNKNNRIYGDFSVEKIISDYKCKGTALYGEFGQPESMEVAADNVSHMILNLYISGDFLYALIEVLKTDSGNKLSNLLKEGLFYFGTRCTGIIVDNNVDVTSFITIDAIPINEIAFDFPVTFEEI